MVKKFSSKPLSKLLSAGEQQMLEQWIADLEQRTAAEFVIVLAESSAGYGHVLPSLLSFSTFALAFVVMVLQKFSVVDWNALRIWHFLLGTVIYFLLVTLLSRSPLVKRWFTSKDDMKIAVQRRAELAFFQRGIHQTMGKTGVLIFVSYVERQVVILADEGVAKLFNPETWRLGVDQIVRGIRSGRFVYAVKEYFSTLMPVLERSVPPSEKNDDELINAIVFL